MNNLVNPAGQQLAVKLKVEGIKTHRTFEKLFCGIKVRHDVWRITIFNKKKPMLYWNAQISCIIETSQNPCRIVGRFSYVTAYCVFALFISQKYTSVMCTNFALILLGVSNLFLFFFFFTSKWGKKGKNIEKYEKVNLTSKWGAKHPLLVKIYNMCTQWLKPR